MDAIQFKKQLKKLPDKPGIYLFKSSRNKPLYIGKALNLKKRVKSYQKTEDTRLQKMISEAKKIDFIQTDSEIEALILESQYIKRYQPTFNVMLRDDKQYSFVGFTEEKFPKIFITHQPRQNVSSIKYQVLRGRDNQKIHNTKYIIHNTDFIGPFTDAGALKTTLNLLRRIFPYCTCKNLHNNYCLNYHIGKCPGFCCVKQQNPNLKFKIQNFKLYRKNIKSVKDILSGKKTSLIWSLEKEMGVLSDKQEYEKALELKYKTEKLKRVFQNAQIIINYSGQQNKTTLAELQKLLKLKQIPARIEAYDIANIQGKHAVGAMVVFENGIANKNSYRKFKIYTKTTADDTAMLREVLIRRFNHPEWPAPDLILMDGGKSQLSAALKVISNLKFKILNLIPVIALAKNERHTGEKIYISGKEHSIPLSRLPRDVKNLLLQIDSEAHRFAINYYRQLHKKSMSNY